MRSSATFGEFRKRGMKKEWNESALHFETSNTAIIIIIIIIITNLLSCVLCSERVRGDLVWYRFSTGFCQSQGPILMWWCVLSMLTSSADVETTLSQLSALVGRGCSSATVPPGGSSAANNLGIVICTSVYFEGICLGNA